MRLLRIWVPDPRRPEFAKEAERQAKLLRGRPEEREALDFHERTQSNEKAGRRLWPTS